MPTNLQLQFLSKTPSDTIRGQQFCVWCYQLSWGVKVHPQGLSAKVGLVFPARLDIKDPALYPGVAEIQGTELKKQAGTDRQYLYKDAPQAGDADVQFCFLAPCDEDSFVPVLLVTSDLVAGPWKSLGFRLDDAGETGPVHTIRGPAVIGPVLAPQAPATAGKLNGAGRRIAKCTYVPLKFDDFIPDRGGGFLKFGFFQRLGLRPGEVDTAGRILSATDDATAVDDSVLSTLRPFEGAPLSSRLPSPADLAALPTSALVAFSRALVTARRQTLRRLEDAGAGDSPPSSEFTTALHRYHTAFVEGNAFENNVTVSPIGILNLERIVMTPVGIQRGELIATVPLAPMEQTAVVHKEWSVTSREFTSIVTDSLENYSETGVTENTELAQSTASQTAHSNQFNINATVSGGYGPVTATVSTGFASQDQTSASASESRKHAVATTRKASARVKQEHKVTISTTTVTGTSETSTRVLQNPSQTSAMRIDYFSIMRKWHVGLYRYGLRLTYDIAIPEPAATLRRIYTQIALLKNQLGPFQFSVGFGDITRATWAGFATQFQATLPPPPPDTDEQSFASSYTINGDTTFFGPVSTLELDLRDGYVVTGATAFTDQQTGGSGTTLFADILFNRTGPGDATIGVSGGAVVALNYLVGLSGRQYVMYSTTGSNSGAIEVDVQLKLTDAAFVVWQQQAWNALYNAAQVQYYAQQRDIQAQVQALEEKLGDVDTLTLRREENEEIMKGVLRWLLGPAFQFMPGDVVDLFLNQTDGFGNPLVDVVHGSAADGGDGLSATSESWFPMLMYQEMVKFINQAIEWENVVYFLYSYFWDVPPSWDFIRQIRHPDSTRQAFLRAGSARVVLTVRKGWEEAWVNFVEAGGFGETLIPGHPYLSIAQEVRDYDQTNYPGIPPANPGGGPLPDDGQSVATVSTDTLNPGAGPVNVLVKSSDGFLVGYTAVIDSYDSKDSGGNTLQEAQSIVAVPDGTHITVERIDNPHSGSPKPFVVMQAGEKGQLIAEWFEYTPTSGTDVAVTSNLETLA
jgi:hypothetical protein